MGGAGVGVGRRARRRVALTWTEKHWPEVQEAMIGVTFILAASGALILLASNPHGAEHLKDLLVGQILWVGPGALAVGRAGVRCRYWRSGSRARAHRPRRFLSVVCVRGDGIGAARRAVPRVHDADRARARDASTASRAPRDLLRAGRCGYALGLLGSAALDLPSGAVIVWTMALLAVPVFVYGSGRAAREHG